MIWHGSRRSYAHKDQVEEGWKETVWTSIALLALVNWMVISPMSHSFQAWKHKNTNFEATWCSRLQITQLAQYGWLTACNTTTTISFKITPTNVSTCNCYLLQPQLTLNLTAAAPARSLDRAICNITVQRMTWCVITSDNNHLTHVKTQYKLAIRECIRFCQWLVLCHHLLSVVNCCLSKNLTMSIWIA